MIHNKLEHFLQGAADFYSAFPEDWFNKKNVIGGLESFLLFNTDPEAEQLAKKMISVLEEYEDTPETFSKAMTLRSFDYKNKSEKDSQLDLIRTLRYKFQNQPEDWFTKLHLLDFIAYFNPLNEAEDIFLESFFRAILIENDLDKQTMLAWLDNISSTLSGNDCSLTDLANVLQDQMKSSV